MDELEIYYWDGELNEKNLDKFLSEFRGGGTLYFESDGGFLYIQQILLDVLNKSETELVAPCSLSSAAADLFLFTTCKKRLLPSFYLMTLHLPDHKMHSRDLHDKNPTPSSVNKATEARAVRKIIKQYRHIGVPEAHIKRILRGEDACLTAAEVKSLDIWGKAKT